MALKLVILLISYFVFNLSAIPVTEDRPSFRNDYTYIASLKLFFKEHTLQQTWANAVAMCSAEGASLLVPKTADEVQVVLSFKDNATTQLWVGIHDMFSEGQFVTLDGKDLSNVYKSWAEWEPNNVAGKENCVTMRNNGLYNDDNCDNQYKYICTKEPTNVPKNVVCETYDAEYVFKSETDRCYKIHKVPRNWNDAFRICKAEQSQLAIINSEAEAKILVEMLEKYPVDSLHGNVDKYNVYLGFNDIITNGIFLTLDGKTLNDAGYDIWANGQPDNHENNERCGSMYRDGKLNDLKCANIAIFICERTLGDAMAIQTHSRFGDTAAA